VCGKLPYVSKLVIFLGEIGEWMIYRVKLELENITMIFGQKQAVKDVNVILHHGIYGLLGANGAGKTTLMKMVCGVLQPSNGNILYNGKNIVKIDEEYRGELGYLPQNFGYYPDFSAQDFMYYMAALKGIEKNKARKKTQELLEQVNLRDDAKKKIRTFSGGMRQRLGIAQALLNEPSILVLDEPTAGLDPKERMKFRNIIEKFSMEKIVIFSTHIVSDIDYIADTVLMMKQGKFILNMPTKDAIDLMKGKVWNVVVQSSEIEKVSKKYRVINIQKRKDEKISLRIISDTEPMEGVQMLQPSLEDLYLYHFQEVNLDE